MQQSPSHQTTCIVATDEISRLCLLVITSAKQCLHMALCIVTALRYMCSIETEEIPQLAMLWLGLREIHTVS